MRNGLELWSSATGGTAMTLAQLNATIAAGNYSGTVWASQDPTDNVERDGTHNARLLQQ